LFYKTIQLLKIKLRAARSNPILLGGVGARSLIFVEKLYI